MFFCVRDQTIKRCSVFVMLVVLVESPYYIILHEHFDGLEFSFPSSTKEYENMIHETQGKD